MIGPVHESVDDLRRRVDEHMRMKYRLSLSDIEQSDVPGYWQDKEPKIHPGHPLHSCLGCSGPFRATYPYFDPPRDRRTGRFSSTTRTWRAIREATAGPAGNEDQTK